MFFFLRNENDFPSTTGLLPSTRLPHHISPTQTIINNLRRQCYVIKNSFAERLKSNFMSYATAAGELL